MVAQMVEESAFNAGDQGLIPGSGRYPGEGNGYSLQYSCLENSKDRGSWWAIVHGTAKCQAQLSDWHTSKDTEWKQWEQRGRGCVWHQAWLLRDVTWTRCWRLKGASVVMTPTHQWFAALLDTMSLSIFFLSSFLFFPLPSFLTFYLSF